MRVQIRIGNHPMAGCTNVLGLVACHFLSEHTIEEVSEVKEVGKVKVSSVVKDSMII